MPLASLPSGKMRRSIGLPEAGGLALFEFLNLVQALEEEQIGDLFDDFDRVGDAAGPEGVPDAVNLIANVAGYHPYQYLI